MEKNIFAILLVCVVAGGALARLTEMSSLNRTPKKPSIFSNICEECESIIRRLAIVANDESKVAELKAILSVLCDETLYKDECRIFVNRLDFILKRLQPYLRNPHQVCHNLHICGNPKFIKFHKVGVFFSKQYIDKTKSSHDLLCEECHFAVQELKTAIEDEKYQKEIKKFFSIEVCAHLGKFRGSCDMLIECFLPDLFVELEKILGNNKTFCVDLKLCKKSKIFNVLKFNNNEDNSEDNSSSDLDFSLETRTKVAKKKSSGALRKLVKTINRILIYQGSVKISMSCLECHIGVDSFMFELQKNHTIQSLRFELKKTICLILPNDLFESCDDFFHLHAFTIVSMTIQRLDRKLHKMQVCKDEIYIPRQLIQNSYNLKDIKCESCKVISQLLLIEMSTPNFRDKLVDDVEHYLCRKIDKRLYFICQNLIKGYTPIILTKVLQSIDNGDLCNKLHACKNVI